MTTSRFCVKRYNLPPSHQSPIEASLDLPPFPSPPVAAASADRRRRQRRRSLPQAPIPRAPSPPPAAAVTSPPPPPPRAASPTSSPGPPSSFSSVSWRKRRSCKSLVAKNVIQFTTNNLLVVNSTLCNLVQLLFILVMAIVFLMKPLNAFQLEVNTQQVKLSLVEGTSQGTLSSLTSSTESKSKSSKLTTTYLARKNTVATAQVLTNCTKNNSFDSKESLIQQSPWYCDFVVAESLLSPSCEKNCFGCNEKSFVLVSSPSKSFSSPGTSSSSSSPSSSNLPRQIIQPSSISSSSKLHSPNQIKSSTSRANGQGSSSSSLTSSISINEDEYDDDEVSKSKSASSSGKKRDADEDNVTLKSKTNDKCLFKKTVNELCKLDTSDRDVYSSSLHLTFCQRYSLQVLTNSSWITANYTTCQLILNSILEQDNLAAKLSCQFNSLLARYNCQSGYSVKWNCSACSNTYRDWICATVLPYYHVDDGKLRKPCREFCERVEQRCPYFHPAGGDQYAGEPTFLCTDPQIPFLTPQVPFGPEDECYSPCDLSLVKLNSRKQVNAIGTAPATASNIATSSKQAKLTFSSLSSSSSAESNVDLSKINSLSLINNPSSEEHEKHTTDIISAGHCGIIRYEYNYDVDDDNECLKREKNTQKITRVSSSIASPADDVYFDDESFPALNSDSKTLSQPLVHDQATAISISVFREDQQNSNDNNNNNNVNINNNNLNDNHNNLNNNQQPEPMSRVTSSNPFHSTLNPVVKSDQQEPSEDTDDELDSNPLLKKTPDSGNS